MCAGAGPPSSPRVAANLRPASAMAVRPPHRLLLAALLTLVSTATPAHSHGDTGSTGATCLRSAGVTLQAPFVPGSLTVDGLADDWGSVSATSLELYPALTEDPKNAYPGGPLQIKVAHDGHDMFFLVQIPGAYLFNANEQNMAAIALMFPVGDDATYHNMGGCPESPGLCNATNCGGHEVDLMHFQIYQAIPGRLYGANIVDSVNGTGKDRFGNLDDKYAWNPHCQSLDGTTPSGNSTAGGVNNWRGSWTHTTTNTKYGLIASDIPFGTIDGAGTYTFEFARPLRTNDVLQQDVQFTIGSTHGMAVAFWYPAGGVVWQPFQHYSASCDWLPLEVVPAATRSSSTDKAGSALGTVALLVSLASLAVAVAVGWWARPSSRVAFNPISSGL